MTEPGLGGVVITPLVSTRRGIAMMEARASFPALGTFTGTSANASVGSPQEGEEASVAGFRAHRQARGVPLFKSLSTNANRIIYNVIGFK